MAKRWAKKLILAKLENTSGTAETLANTDAVVAKNIEHAPLAGGEAERELARPYFGASESIPVNTHETLSFDVELAGSGTAGTAPAWGALLQGCGFAETVTANTAAAYSPVSSGEKSLTISLNIDGVLHQMTQCRGNVTLDASVDNIPMLRFAFIGRRVAETDTAATASPNFSKYQTPLVVAAVNTPSFELHGVTTLKLSSLTYDAGIQVAHRSVVNGPEVLIGDRQGSGTITIDREALSVFNPVDRAVKASTGALQLVHGKTGGQIIQVDMPKVQFTTVEHADNEGAWQGQIGYRPLPNAAASGNDEIKITVK